MVQAMLGLRADAPHKRLYVNPTLPTWLSELQLQHLRVGPCSFALHFWREGDETRWEVTRQAENIEVVQRAWEAWPTAVPG